MNKVSVVILNYNGSDFLRTFIPILIENTHDADLIVADNASTDDSLEVLKSFSAVRLILLNENLGFAGGYNEALKQVQSEYYLLLNSDVEVTPGWLPPLVDFLDGNKKHAAVQPKILDFNQREKFEYAGACGGYIDSLGYPYCRGRIFQSTEVDQGQYDGNKDIFWASGAAFMIRSAVFHHVGGFDASFFAHMEEIDLCWRLHSHGHFVAAVPSSKVYHVGGGTLNKINPKKTFLNFRNGIRLLIKNQPQDKLIIQLPLRMFFDSLAFVYLLFTQSPAHSFAVVRAYKASFKFLRKDLRNEPKTKMPSHLAQVRNITVCYFLMGEKTFKEINSTK